MESRFIIIAILIFVKIIGIASHTKAENYLPGYNCDDTVIYTTNCPKERKDNDQFNYIFSQSNYRCGNVLNNYGIWI